MKAAHDEIVKLKGEKTKLSDEHEQAVALYQKRERTNISNVSPSWKRLLLRRLRRAKLMRFLLKRLPRIASGYLHAVFLCYIADRIVKSDELAKYMFELGEAAYENGHKDGYGKGRAAAVVNEKVDHFDLYKLSRKADAVETLKKALGDEDVNAGGVGTSHQV
ncbi:hypothetical protein HanRHA438_Chr01g0008101 [Helianthus annuus]|nr:hypothetical protein HanRHA438_Chr01g0008101 [Helianthus annuus]KAJ0955843.1 hypothetical protein HanPSC8_Chr01g0007591 [Helianthus annuus]